MIINNLNKINKLIYMHHFKPSEFDKLVELELYKLVTRSQLETYIGTIHSPVTKVGEVCGYPYGISSDGKTATIMHSIHNIPDNKIITKIELMLSDVDLVNVIQISPLDYMSLDAPVEYNPDILLRVIIADCINKNVANLHLETVFDNNEVRHIIRYRINERLIEQSTFKLNYKLLTSIISTLVDKNTKVPSTDLLTPSGVSSSCSDYIQGSGIDLRIAINIVNGGYNCAIRIQSSGNTSRAVEELGFNPLIVKSLRGNTNFRTGLILFTGAKSTGKNTSAIAFCRELCGKGLKIQSYESPVEVPMPFPQIDYQDDIKSLKNGILLSKKQDVDFIFVNEIPGKDVAFALRDVVNSSIGAISTMHIDRLWHLPYKLFELYNEEYKDVISQLRVVYNQKMFSVLCPHCSRKYSVLDLEDDILKDVLSSMGVNYVSVETGCPKCDKTNPNIRVRVQPYCEFLEFTPTIRSELLKIDTPWQMELYLKSLLLELNQNLEVFVAEGLQQDKISINGLYQFM